MRVISEIRKATNGLYPRISIWENVAGALTSNDGHDFGLIIDTMADMGAMVIEWALLDAQHFGIPTIRRRVFVVAVFDTATAERCVEPILPVQSGVCWYPAQGSSQEYGTSYTSGVGITGQSASEQLVLFADLDGDHLEIANSQDQVPLVIAFNHTAGLNIQASESRWPTLKANGAHNAVAVRTVLNGDCTGKMAVRRLTPIECERLMGWPDDHTRWRSDGSEQSDGRRYKQCGNGVVAPVASWVGSQIIRIFSAVTLENEPQHKGNT